LLGRNQTELKGLGSHVRQNAVSGAAVVVETIWTGKRDALPVFPAAAHFPSFNSAPASLSLRACPDLRAAPASRRNVYPRHHKQRTENCVEQDARAVWSPGHSLSPSSPGMHLVIRDICGKRCVVCDLRHTSRFGIPSWGRKELAVAPER